MRIMVTHEVDDVQHWLGSPKREEFFGAHGMTAHTFVSFDGGDGVGLIVEDVPDMATLQSLLQTDEAAAAMKHDGVRPDTIRMYVES